MTTNVYIQASYANPFRSGYGVVIEYQGTTQELGYTDNDGASANRLLLVGCLVALRAIPEDRPVCVHCADEYLTRWTLPRVTELHGKGFKKTPRGKPMPNHDVMAELAEVVECRAGVKGVIVPKARWCEYHSRAEAIALEHGAGGVLGVKAADPAKRRVKPAPRPRASAIETTAEGTTIRDYGVDDDAPCIKVA